MDRYLYLGVLVSTAVQLWWLVPWRWSECCIVSESSYAGVPSLGTLMRLSVVTGNRCSMTRMGSAFSVRGELGTEGSRKPQGARERCPTRVRMYIIDMFQVSHTRPIRGWGCSVPPGSPEHLWIRTRLRPIRRSEEAKGNGQTCQQVRLAFQISTPTLSRFRVWNLMKKDFREKCKYFFFFFVCPRDDDHHQGAR